MEREKVLTEVPLCALAMLELVELSAYTVPPLYPELHRPVGLVLDRTPFVSSEKSVILAATAN